MKLDEKTIEKKYIYKGRINTLRTVSGLQPNCKHALRDGEVHRAGVSVAALTDDYELMFVRQFRYPYSEVLLELPAGKLEYGEDPFEAGKRELREETGAVAEHYIDLGKFYPTPGYCGEIIHMYAAKGLSFTSLALDDDEFLASEKIPLEKAVEMVMNNEIRDGKTQTAVLKVAQKRRKGKI